MKNTFKDSWAFFSGVQKASFIILFLSAILIGVLVPLLLPNSYIPNLELSRDYKAGELSDEDVYSPVSVSFIDEVATENLRNSARSTVLPHYAFDFLSSMNTLLVARSYATSLSPESTVNPFSVLREAGIEDTSITTALLNLSEEERNVISNLIAEGMEFILRQGLYSVAELNESVAQGYMDITGERIDSRYRVYETVEEISSLMTVENLFESLIRYGLSYFNEMGERNIILTAGAIRMLAAPNVIYDMVETERRRQESADSTDPISIRVKEGDLLILRDSVITEQDLRIIDQINSMRHTLPFSTLIAYAMYLFTILAFAFYLFTTFIQYKYRVPLYSILFVAGLNIILILCYLMMGWILSSSDRITVDSLLPFLFLPVLFTFITNKRRIGFTVGFVIAAFAVIFPTSTNFTFFYLLVTIVASIPFARMGTNRIDVIYEALYSALLSAVASAVFSLISGYSYGTLASNIVFIIVNVLATYILASIALPLLEKAFNLPSQFRLHELSYTDSPSLNRLSQVAQGTYNHVRNVADMSYAAAKNVGANAELARVGALYHDIGKAEHPEYFVENQGGKANAHDELNNNLSAAIIKSHVKLGVEKGKEIALPQEVLDIISQHHGNDIITYFYNEARKNMTDGRFVHEEDFRYNSEIPQTPEAAIVMLADCVEAASRTLKNPNTQKYDRLIMNIIISKITHKQLTDSKLTLTDLFKIKDTFIRSLVGRDHQRIEYDNDKD